jgi:hypothetical protein
MDRKDMGSNIGKDQELISVVTQVVKEVARVPVWAKLTPSTTDIVVEGARRVSRGRRCDRVIQHLPSLPPVDPDTLEFEMNVDGFVSSGGLGGPAILPLSLAKMAQLTQAFPDKSFSGIGGIADFSHALNYFLLGCGTVQGLHRGDARSRDWTERHEITRDRHGANDGTPRLANARRLSWHAPRSHRAALADPQAGCEGLSRRLRR